MEDPPGSPRRAAWLAAFGLILAAEYVAIALRLGFGPPAAIALVLALGLRPVLGVRFELSYGRPVESIGLALRLGLALSAATAVLLAVAFAISPEGAFRTVVGGLSPPRVPLERYLLGAVVLAPLVEEFVYRGLLQQALREATGPVVAVFVCGLVFWVAHWIGHGEITSPHTIVSGWVLGYAYEKSRSLLAPTLLHALGNLGLLLLQELFSLASSGA